MTKIEAYQNKLIKKTAPSSTDLDNFWADRAEVIYDKIIGGISSNSGVNKTEILN